MEIMYLYEQKTGFADGSSTRVHSLTDMTLYDHPHDPLLPHTFLQSD